MKLESITTFVTVAQSGSLSEAARRLRISRSVVSERLVDLEKELGTSLLQRTTRKVTVTENGTAFLTRAIRILHEVEEATADLAARRGSLSGPLRISAPVTFGRMHLGPALFPFLARHPEIQMTLDLNDRRVDAAADGYDAVIRHGPIPDSFLVAWEIATSRRILVASPAYLMQHTKPTSLAELEGHRGIFYAHRGGGDWRFVQNGHKKVVHGQSALVLNNGDMMRDAAIAGLGIALLPVFIISSAVRDGSLIMIDIGLTPEQEFIYIAHPDGRNPSAKLRAMAVWLKDTFGSPPYWETEFDEHLTS
ncbi:LysR family transcriptional regulator [Thalassospira povalilytica]|uniref:LysR family transcriptional regulator n=1 Tax=Thalassospira povalilytica TaxID=732237 RepID=UPI001D17ED48|nr:LysR family transcriptional regulator [Thalassospira povalilytica]MCC4241416.1 LysR family transcriptional regulator [Thalassospira povalilytica]